MASYYSVDAILTDAQKVPCTFEIDIPGLGFIDGNIGTDIKKGAKVNLPLWLGGYLAVQKFGEPILSTDLPASLGPRVLNALKANPKTVDLRALAPHFYELAARALDLFDEDEIVDVLTQTFKARAAEIADHATHTQGSLVEAGGFLRGLDEMERQRGIMTRSIKVFRAAHDSSKSVKTWLGENAKKRT